MTQDQNSDAIGKRIRALRDSETQAKFAEKIGVTRSALANYETGRTIPNDLVVLRIANATGVNASSITSGEAYSFDDLAALIGAKQDTASVADLTDHERAIVRVLRVCKSETVLEVVTAILDGLNAVDVVKEAIDPITFGADFKILAEIKAHDGFYDRGITRDTLAAIMAHLDSRAAKKNDQENGDG